MKRPQGYVHDSAMLPWDEMYDADGEVRPGRDGLAGALEDLGSDELLRRARLRDAHLSAQGITFTLSGRERPLPMDLVPRIVDAAEWQVIEAGVAQRIRALEMFLADVYGAGEILRDQVIPRKLGHQLGALPPRGARRPARQRGADPRRRRRPRPRRRGHVPGAGGQPAQPVGRLLRPGEPAHAVARGARDLHRLPAAQRRGVPRAAARRPARRRPARRRRARRSWC